MRICGGDSGGKGCVGDNLVLVADRNGASVRLKRLSTWNFTGTQALLTAYPRWLYNIKILTCLL